MRLKFFGFLVVLILANQAIYGQQNPLTENEEKSKKQVNKKIDIDSLINEISFNSQHDAFSNYSYQMQFTKRKKTFFGKGKLVQRYNVLLPSRIPKDRIYKHRLLLIYDSSRAISPADIVSNRNQIIEELDKVDSEIVNAKKPSKDAPKVNTGGYLTLMTGAKLGKKRDFEISLLKLIDGVKFNNYKEINFNGRETISLEFRPRSGKKFPEELFYVEKLEGVMLIDKEDKRIVEVEAFPLGKMKEFRKLEIEEREKYRVFHYRQTRVPEGFWFPKSITLNFMKFSKQFYDMGIKIDFAFSKYKRFTVNVGDYKPAPVPIPEESDLPEKVKPKPSDTESEPETSKEGVDN